MTKALIVIPILLWTVCTTWKAYALLNFFRELENENRVSFYKFYQYHFSGLAHFFNFSFLKESDYEDNEKNRNKVKLINILTWFMILSGSITIVITVLRLIPMIGKILDGNVPD